MQQELRSEARYFVVTPVAGEIGGVNADLVDLSTRGARLQTTRRLDPGSMAELTLRTGGVSIATPVTIVWCDVAALAFSDDESDRYLAGVMFSDSLAVIRNLIDDLVASKAALPVADSRSSQRYRVIVPLTASFCDLAPLRVLDLSIRGARLLTPEQMQPGTSGRLRFTVEGRDMHVWLPATVVWSRPAERQGLFEAGLRIGDAEEAVRAIIYELSLRNGVVIDAGERASRTGAAAR